MLNTKVWALKVRHGDRTGIGCMGDSLKKLDGSNRGVCKRGLSPSERPDVFGAWDEMRRTATESSFPRSGLRQGPQMPSWAPEAGVGYSC